MACHPLVRKSGATCSDGGIARQKRACMIEFSGKQPSGYPEPPPVANEGRATALENTAKHGHLPGDLTDTWGLGERVCDAHGRFDPIPGKPAVVEPCQSSTFRRSPRQPM
jgi:hypothetical protein